MILRILGCFLGLREAVREIGRTEHSRGGGPLLDRPGPPRVLP